MQLKHDELRGDVYIKQIKKNTYRIISKMYNKLNFCQDITYEEIKGYIIDFIINGYIIVHNSLTDITNEIYDFIENYKIENEEKEEGVEEVKKEDII